MVLTAIITQASRHQIHREISHSLIPVSCKMTTLDHVPILISDQSHSSLRRSSLFFFGIPCHDMFTVRTGHMTDGWVQRHCQSLGRLRMYAATFIQSPTTLTENEITQRKCPILKLTNASNTYLVNALKAVKQCETECYWSIWCISTANISRPYH